MLQKLFSCIIICLCLCFSVKSQSSTQETNSVENSSGQSESKENKSPFVSISGSVDAYFRYDLNRQLANNKTSFTNSQNAFTLGMASVRLEHSSGKVNMVADLGFGTRAAEFSYNNAGILSAVKQLTISYVPVDRLKFTLGTWATHIGYELVDPQFNRNYSMSYMFTNGPFTHTGLKAEYTLGKSSFMIGISDPTDLRIIPTNKINRKYAIAQYSYAVTDDIKLYMNYVGGKNIDTAIINQFDLVATASFSKSFNAVLNASLNRSRPWDGFEKVNLAPRNWWGIAGYFNYDLSAIFGMTLRSEYFNDQDAVKGFGTYIFANTFSANFKLGAITFIPELRCENAGKTIYTSSQNRGAQSSFSILVGAVYKF